jgi:hypothetical protein
MESPEEFDEVVTRLPEQIRRAVFEASVACEDAMFKQDERSS